MVGRLQTRSTASDAATRLAAELSDDEWRSLLNLVRVEIAMIVLEEREDSVIRELRTGTLQAARQAAVNAIAHVRAILSD